MQLADRTALVTGASAGIGRALALELARRGASPILVARRQERLEQVAKECEQRGVRAHVIARDLSTPDAAKHLVAALAERGLKVDVLVNNAGFGPKRRFSKAGWEDHRALLQLMLVGVVELTHRLLPSMLEQHWGRILHVASLAGMLPSTPGATLYGPTKSFLIKFARGLAEELEDSGVSVCALCPGYTHSEFHDLSGSRARVSRLPGALWMGTLPVAREGIDALLAGEHVHVPGRVNRALLRAMGVLPEGVVQRIVGGRSGH